MAIWPANMNCGMLRMSLRWWNDWTIGVENFGKITAKIEVINCYVIMKLRLASSPHPLILELFAVRLTLCCFADHEAVF